MLYAELDRLDEARAEFERLAPDDFAAVARDSLWPATGSFLGEVCIALGDKERAGVLYRELGRFADRNLMVDDDVPRFGRPGPRWARRRAWR